jgi:hypothetical protein
VVINIATLILKRYSKPSGALALPQVYPALRNIFMFARNVGRNIAASAASTRANMLVANATVNYT